MRSITVPYAEYELSHPYLLLFTYIVDVARPQEEKKIHNHKWMIVERESSYRPVP